MSTAHTSAGFTRADLDRMPEDDGLRYEIIDGELYVTPAPAPVHQLCVARLIQLLTGPAEATGLLVLPAPLDVAISEDTAVEPDVVVIAPDSLDGRGAIGRPALVIEVLSPSSRATDLVRKRARYARARFPNYWVIDPIAPSLTVFALGGDAYVEVARASGEVAFRATAPLAVTVIPAALVAPLSGFDR